MMPTSLPRTAWRRSAQGIRLVRIQVDPHSHGVTSPRVDDPMRFGRVVGDHVSGSQLVHVAIDLPRLNDAARVLVANVEMVPAMLVGRAAARRITT